MTIQELIKQMAAAGVETYCKACSVDSVDEAARTIDCTPIDESAPLMGVNLQANQNSEVGDVSFPVVDSYVVVAFISPMVAVVVMYDEIEKRLLTIGEMEVMITTDGIVSKVGEMEVTITKDGVVINGGEFGGLIKIKEITDKINALVDAFNSHEHMVLPSGIVVTGSPATQTNTAPVKIPAIMKKHKKVAAKDYENEKVKH